MVTNKTWDKIQAYNGKVYDVRVVYDKDGEQLLIGNDDLLNDIHPGEWGSIHDGFDPSDPKRAENLYNEIFFFTDDTTFNLDDAALRKEMARENPDYFI